MNVNGTLINYYIHCRRQCYLHGNRLNMEDNSELVKVGKALHEEKDDGKETEIEIENIKIDKLTKEYLVEVKKSDADIEATKWQLLFYLSVLRSKGIDRKGKLQIMEKNKMKGRSIILELDEESEKRLKDIQIEIVDLIDSDEMPPVSGKASCKKCAYYEYCYI